MLIRWRKLRFLLLKKKIYDYVSKFCLKSKLALCDRSFFWYKWFLHVGVLEYLSKQHVEPLTNVQNNLTKGFIYMKEKK